MLPVGKTTHKLLVVCCSLVALPLLAATGDAAPLSPYAAFQAMTLSDMATLQVKLTYVGDYSNATIAGVLFGASATVLDPGLFIPYRRTDQVYANDDGGHIRFTATAQELKALIDNVGALSGVTDGNVDPGGFVSFALLNTVGGTKAFEAILDTTNAPALIGQVLTALANNAKGVNVVRRFGCAVGGLPVSAPARLQSEVQLTLSGFRADRNAKGQFVSKLRLTNVSGSPIAGPVLIIARIGGGDLIGADGETCNIAPSGAQFLRIVGAGGIPSGGHVECEVRITNPSNTKMAAGMFEAYAGGGTP